jgi:hypothetical protein
MEFFLQKHKYRTKNIVAVTILTLLDIACCTAMNHVLTDLQRHVVTCVSTIMHRYFPPEHTVLLSMPSAKLWVPRRTIEISFEADNEVLVELSARSIYEISLWSLQMSRPGVETLENELEGSDEHHNYIIYTWPDEEDGSVLTNVISQVEEMKTRAWLNPRERYLVVITDTGTSSPSEAALSILMELWSNYVILDVLIMVPDITCHNTDTCEFPTTSTGINRFLLYTWFPYHQSGEEVILINTWDTKNGGNLLRDSDLFPSKIPYKINSPPLRVATLDLEPFVVLDGTYTDENDKKMYIFKGPETELLHFIMKHLNISFYYLPPPPNDTKFFDQIVTSVKRVAFGEADVGIGSLPLLLEAASYVDFTVPYFYTGDRWYVPCPRPSPRLKRIAGIFHETTWLIMAVVLLLVVTVTWVSATRVARRESHSYRSLSGCLLNMCSVFLLVPAPVLPRTSVTRLCFLSFVWYSLAMSIVIQTSLTSILVNPGLNDQLRSFEEILYSGIEYSYVKDLHYYYFPEGSGLYGEEEMNQHGQNCSDYKECLSRVINEGDYASLRSEIYADYFVAKTMPKRIKPLCYLDSIFKTYMVNMYIQKNTPLLNSFNRIIRSALEGGFISKMLVDTKDTWRHQTSSDAEGYDAEDTEVMYFVFTTEHLTPAFYILFFGYASSFVIFIGELLYWLGVVKLPNIIIYHRKG